MHDQCDYSTTRKGGLVRHKRSHTGEKPYSCSLCQYKTNDLSTLNKHILTLTGAKPFVCSECDYRAARKTCLTVHMRTHSNEKPFSCEYDCPYKAAIRKYVAKHISRVFKRHPMGIFTYSYQSLQICSL